MQPGAMLWLLATSLLAATNVAAIWSPAPTDKWQYQLSTVLKVPAALVPGVTVYDIDGADTPAATVAALHARGLRAVCYFSAGTWEKWRSDKADFPDDVLGAKLGWRGERWLDIRAPVLRAIMEARLDMCQAKGFDAVEADNVDGWDNRTSFPLTSAHALAYITFLADAAHARGMSFGLKNDLAQVGALAAVVDFAVNEQCFQYKECGKYAPLTALGKAVLNVEYAGTAAAFTAKVCPASAAAHFSSIYKHLRLEPYHVGC